MRTSVVFGMWSRLQRGYTVEEYRAEVARLKDKAWSVLYKRPLRRLASDPSKTSATFEEAIAVGDWRLPIRRGKAVEVNAGKRTMPVIARIIPDEYVKALDELDARKRELDARKRALRQEEDELLAEAARRGRVLTLKDCDPDVTINY